MQPLVSILFPCYNAARYLPYSLESLLNQDYSNLEIICINDGSSDTTLDMLKSYQERDRRIVIVDNPKNLGLIGSLNKSFSYIHGDYFARMDADDFSPPERLIQQMDFLLRNPELDLVSSGYNYFTENGRPQEYVAPVGTLPNALRFISLFATPLAHGSLCARTKVIREGLYYYDKNYAHAEDFELFSRLCWQGVTMTSIKESLYQARLNEGSVSAVYTEAQIRTNHNIVWRNLREYLGFKDHLSEANLKVLTSRIDKTITFSELKEGHALFETFYRIAEEKLHFSPAEKKQIRDYMHLHRLNSIIQSNKILLKSGGVSAIGFFLSSLSLLRFRQLGPLFKKLVKPVFYKR